MMRCFNTDQQKLYQQYCALSSNIADILQPTHERNLLHKNVLDLIADEGLWLLPISNRYGGQGLSWQDCVAALTGLFSHDTMLEFLPLLISHLGILYLISRYATEAIKKRYLPRLIKGGMAHLFMPNSINSLLSGLELDKKVSPYSPHNNLILIYVKKADNMLSFYISENKSCSVFIKVNSSNRSLIVSENEFIKRNIGLSVLRDLINFLKLIYGILSSRFISKINLSKSIYAKLS